MVGPFGEPDDVFTLKMEFLQLGTLLYTVFATSVALAPFENEQKEFIFQGFAESRLGYYLAKIFWTVSMIFVAFAWWLESRTTGLGFTYRVAFHATLVGGIILNILWPRYYFLDDGKPRRFGISMFLMALSILSTVASVIFLSVNLFQSWAVLTAKASGIVADIFVFVNVVMMALAFVYFYTLQMDMSEKQTLVAKKK